MGAGRGVVGVDKFWIVAARTTLLAGVITFVGDRSRGDRGSDLSATGALTLLAGHVTLAAIVVLAGLLGFGLARLVSRSRRRTNVVVAAGVWIGLASWPLLRIGSELASGAWISEQSWAPLVRFAPLVAWIAAAPIVAAIACATPSTRRRRIIVAAALAIAAVAFELFDRRFQPGQYPELHMLAHAMAVVCIVLLARTLVLAAASRRVLAIVATVLCLAAPGVWLTMASTTRAELLLRSSVAEHWIRHATPHRQQRVLKSQLAELDAKEGRYRPADEQGGARGLIDARDMNVVLVVVDTMRADTLAPMRKRGQAWAKSGDTPFLDEWLAHSYLFTRAYAAATNTGRSTPTLMRSIQSFDDPYDGVALGPRMQALGYTACATVLDFFFAGKQKQAEALLEGFEDVVVFERGQTGVAVPEALAQLERVGDRPFLAWVHLYPLHEPGFDGRLLGDGDGSRTVRYRKSLRWLDGQMRELVEGIDALGLGDDTIVVLASDHGEGLGDHGAWLHGSVIYDEVLHVPMAFAIPGQAGGRIDTLVGNIDLVPTLMDLLGAGAQPTDRGRSLVPLMVGEADTVERSYYAETSRGTFTAVVRGHDKLIYDVDSDVFHHYDLAMDPRERVDVFDPSGPLDRELIRELAAYKPELFADELADEDVRELLAQRVAEIDPHEPGAALPFLVRLVAAEPTPALVDDVVALAEQSDDRGLRLLVLRYMWPHAKKRLEDLLEQWIAEVGDGEEGLAFVDALAGQGQAAFAQKAVARRLVQLAERGRPTTWDPWLRLVKSWKRRAREHAPPLTTMLERSHRNGDPRRIALVLDVAAGLIVATRSSPADVALLEALANEVRSYARHPDARVRAAVLRALATLRDGGSRQLVRERLLDGAEDVRVRRAAVDTLAVLAGDDATADFVAVGLDRRFTNTVVIKLRSMGSAVALPFLRTIAKHHHNPYTRKDAAKAIDRIDPQG